MDKQLTCIICPQGCRITITGSEGDFTVLGYKCPRGFEYAKKEFVNPERVLTSSVKVIDGELPLVSVKTTAPVPKKRILELMEEVKKAKGTAPIAIGTVIIRNLGETGVKLVATRNVGKKKQKVRLIS